MTRNYVSLIRSMIRRSSQKWVTHRGIVPYDEAEKQEGEAEMKAGGYFEVLASRNLDVHGNRRLQDRRLAMVPPKRRGRCSRITHVKSVRSQRMMKRLLCICHEV